MTDGDKTPSASGCRCVIKKWEEAMEKTNGKQTIGCGVTSCRFNNQGMSCDLNRIEVKPSCDCHTGDCWEAQCGSYVAK